MDSQTMVWIESVYVPVDKMLRIARPRTADEAHEVEHWVKRLEGKRS
jgi:hypothetical protein